MLQDHAFDAELYSQLRSLAARHMRRLPPGQTIQPTEVVHEALMRVARREDARADRELFLLVARCVRDIIVEHSRRRVRRSEALRGAAQELAFSDGCPELVNDQRTLLELAHGIDELQAVDPRKAEVVVLRIFGGRTIEDTAMLLSLSPATVERDWRFARAWLLARLTEQRSED